MKPFYYHVTFVPRFHAINVNEPLNPGIVTDVWKRISVWISTMEDVINTINIVCGAQQLGSASYNIYPYVQFTVSFNQLQDAREFAKGIMPECQSNPTISYEETVEEEEVI